MSLYFDRQCRSITLEQWARLFEDKSYQIVEQTWTRSGAQVSTVWLGLDHSFLLEGPPIIFETMVFHDGEDLLQERDTTEQQARARHADLVARFGGADPAKRPDQG